MRTPGPAQFDFSGVFVRPPRATLSLMVVTAIVSVVAMFDAGRWGIGIVTHELFFSPWQVIDRWRIWTPFTYLFLVRDPLHLVLYETFALWMFAAPLERQWGSRRFLVYFFGTGTGAAIFTALLGMWSAHLRVAPVDGAWVATEAVVLGWILMNWYATVYLFIIPVRAPFLLVLSLGLPALYMLMGEWEPFVAPLAGMGIGYLMLKRGVSPHRTWLHLRAWWIERQLRRRARHLRVVRPKDDESETKGPRYLN